MRNLKNLLLVAALAVAFSPLPGLAQRPLEQGQEGRPGPDREEMRGMLEAYIISKLQEALQLNDEQYAKVIVAQKKLNEHRREHQRQRAQTLRELRRAVGATEPSDEEIANLLGRLEKLRLDFETQQREDYKAMDALLTVKQRARYRLLEIEIERRMQELIREIRRERRPGAAPQPPR
jgi:Spy/CpxP family protein refolding chaperone